MPPAIVELFRHNLWANLRLLDACAGLSDGQLDAGVTGTYGGVRNTFVHIAASEARYIEALAGRDPSTPRWEDEPFPGFEELRERLRRSGEEFVAIAERHDPGQVLSGTVPRTGEPYEMSISIPLLQAINHGTEHRSHIATVLSQAGIEPPTLDGWTYWRTIA